VKLDPFANSKVRICWFG